MGKHAEKEKNTKSVRLAKMDNQKLKCSAKRQRAVNKMGSQGAKSHNGVQESTTPRQGKVE